MDPSNLSLVLSELAINGLRDPRAAQLHEELTRECKELTDGNNDAVAGTLGCNAEHEQTKLDENTQIAPHIKAWMQTVQSKSDLKWCDFKTTIGMAAQK